MKLAKGKGPAGNTVILQQMLFVTKQLLTEFLKNLLDVCFSP
jgi:hypothetical protein